MQNKKKSIGADECVECRGKLVRSTVREKIKGQTILLEAHVCKRCGSYEVDLDEYQRIYTMANPPFSRRIHQMLSYPAELIRRVTW
jgi:hypothetical protein